MSGRRAVILAGGRGTRLGPFTTVLPKPLLPIGDRAILEIVVHQLREHGFTELTFAVGYLAHLIHAVFGDGKAPGRQHQLPPRGPAARHRRRARRHRGPGRDLPDDERRRHHHPGLRRPAGLHTASENIVTIASHRRVNQIDYGVLQLGEALAGGEHVRQLVGYVEKPRTDYVVSMGVYILEPQALQLIGRGQKAHPELLVQEHGDASQQRALEERANEAKSTQFSMGGSWSSSSCLRSAPPSRRRSAAAGRQRVRGDHGPARPGQPALARRSS